MRFSSGSNGPISPSSCSAAAISFISGCASGAARACPCRRSGQGASITLPPPGEVSQSGLPPSSPIRRRRWSMPASSPPSCRPRRNASCSSRCRSVSLSLRRVGMRRWRWYFPRRGHGPPMAGPSTSSTDWPAWCWPGSACGWSGTLSGCGRSAAGGAAPPRQRFQFVFLTVVPSLAASCFHEFCWFIIDRR